MTSTVVFQACFPNAGDFKKILDTISGLMKDCIFHITPNGLFVDAVDEQRICLISLSLPDSYFSQFRCNKQTQICLKLQSLNKLIKFCDTDDTVTLTQRESQPDILDILVESKKFRQTMNFTLRLNHADGEDFSSDKYQPDTVITMNSSRFGQLVKDLQAVGSIVQISSSQSDATASFEITGDEANACITIGSSKEEDGQAQIDVSKDIELRFTLKYFVLFSKAGALSDKVRIELGEGAPVVVVYEWDQCKISFLLACAVDGDEEEPGDAAGVVGDDI